MMIEIVPGITTDPERAFGRPVVAGTRITAAEVLASLAAGCSEAQIQAEHGLTAMQIRAVLRYAAVLAEQTWMRRLSHSGPIPSATPPRQSSIGA